ncbi:MAG TPA: universal stress protein [Burkholderiaceae bacterium]
MTYRTLLLHLDDDRAAEVRNGQAVDLALRIDAHVNGLSCHRPTAMGAEFAAALGGPIDPLTRELQFARQQAIEREQRFRSLCERRAVPSFETAIDDTEEAGRAILRRAPLHDLVVLGQPDPLDPDASGRRDFVADVVQHSPRPTLLFPYAGSFKDVGRTTLVAWDGSHGAARAVSDALPLLKQSRDVVVVQFDREAGLSGPIDQSPLHGVIRWLGRHQVEASGSVRFTDGDIGNALLSHAADVGADLLVMGCWGHSRWAERLLGGATRTVMESMTVPVLTSH